MKREKEIERGTASKKVGPACRVTPCDRRVLFAQRPFNEKRRSLVPKKGRRNLSFIHRRTPLGTQRPSETRTRRHRLPRSGSRGYNAPVRVVVTYTPTYRTLSAGGCVVYVCHRLPKEKERGLPGETRR